MRGQLFGRTGNNFKIEYCANCGKYLTVKIQVTIGDDKFKVCSLDCEKELKTAREAKQADETFAEKL